MKYIISITLILTILSGCANFVQKNPEITQKELKQHIDILASDKFEGRATGSAGDSLAAAYIAKQLKIAGFEPLTDNGFQSFSVPSKVIVGESNALKAGETVYESGTDFNPFAFSTNGSLAASVVFAGYGFTIDQEQLKWNDYDGVDVTGKWVMIFRADPEVDQTNSLFAPYSADRDKALLAKDNGAAGVLMISGELFDPKDEMENPGNDVFSLGIPVLRITRKVADDILSGTGKDVKALESQLNNDRKPSSFGIDKVVDGSSEVVVTQMNTRNVVMVHKGKGNAISSEYLVIGAHFDHLGWGGPGSSSRATDTIAIHYGADDNASGVAMMIELAEKLAAEKKDNSRSIIAIAFSGEESGLLGSKYFVNNSPIDLKAVNAMVNLDMVGRLRETKVLQISGTGTTASFRDLLNSHVDTAVLSLALSDEGYGPSDHSSFYGKDIPVLFVSSGAHLDYHTPADSPDKINYEGMMAISDYMVSVTSALLYDESKLVFQEAGPKEQQSRGSRRKGVTLGIMPDFAGNTTDGLRADFVTPGKPAALGGMIKGDIIVAINGKPISNIQDYMFRLNQLKFGETIHVEIVRDGKKEVLLIQL